MVVVTRLQQSTQVNKKSALSSGFTNMMLNDGLTDLFIALIYAMNKDRDNLFNVN